MKVIMLVMLKLFTAGVDKALWSFLWLPHVLLLNLIELY